jgi:hypothetical protein
MKNYLSLYKNNKWVLKLVLQKFISLLPFANQVNFCLSRAFGWLRKDIIAIRSKQQVKYLSVSANFNNCNKKNTLIP